MATIGNLIVAVTARTKPFEKGMDRARTKLTQFKSAVAKVSGAVKLMGVAMAAAAVTGIGVMIREQLKSIDATTKMARSLGLATEELIALQHGAAIAGLEIKQLDTGLRRLAKNVSDAELGLTTAIRAFDDLGLTWQELIDLPLNEQLKMVADRLSRMTNETTRTRVVLDLFGRSGLGFIELLKEGAAGVDAMRVAIEELGIGFTENMGRKVEAANDQMERAKKTWEALFIVATIRLAPAIELVANVMESQARQGFTFWIPFWGKLIAAYQQTELMQKRLARQAEITTAAFRKQLTEMDEFRRNLLEFGATPIAPDVPVPTVSGGVFDLEGFKKAVEAAAKVVRDLQKDVDLFTFDLRRQVETFGLSAAEVALWTLEQRGASAAALELARALAVQLEELEKQAQLIERGKQITQQFLTPLERFNERMMELNDLLKEQAIGWDTFERAVKSARDELEKATKVKEEGAKPAGSFRQVTLGRAALGPTRGGGIELISTTKEMLQRVKDILQKLQDPEPVSLKWEDN